MSSPNSCVVFIIKPERWVPIIPKKNKTLAMMTEDQKNEISHRSLAIEKFLDNYYTNKK